MSRYITFYTSTGTSKFTTLATNVASVSTATLGRRLTLLTGNQTHFVAFGTSTVTASTSSAVIPANSIIDLNITTGTHIAVLSPGGASYITIVDAD